MVNGIANVSVQWARILRPFRTSTECGISHVVYDIRGFGDRITIWDYRSGATIALDKFLDSENAAEFLEFFNTPSYLVVMEGLGGYGYVDISLHDYIGESKGSRYELLIMVGLKDEIPVYEYELETLEPYGNGFSFIGVRRIEDV